MTMAKFNPFVFMAEEGNKLAAFHGIDIDRMRVLLTSLDQEIRNFGKAQAGPIDITTLYTMAEANTKTDAELKVMLFMAGMLHFWAMETFNNIVNGLTRDN